MNKAEQFIKDYTRSCSNELCYEEGLGNLYEPWLTPDQALRAVEIEREAQEEKLSKAIRLADAMYYAAQMISTGASHLSKAMKDWWQFKNVELKESEDERIRERLIEFFKDWGKTRSHCWSISISDILAWLEKQGEQKPQRMISAEAKEALYDKPVGKAEPFDKYEGLTDFERTLADICIGWIGEEPGWKQYIKDNSDVLLRIATEKFNSVQDAPSEQKPAWSEEDEKILNAAILHIKNETYNYYGEYSSECIMQWLKSLKDRVQPRDNWKPSYEQMDALNTYIYNPQYFNTPDPRMELVISIYEDLKKLMEE